MKTFANERMQVDTTEEGSTSCANMEVIPLRKVIENVLSFEQCQELIHIHRCNSVVGYRDHFTVTTIRELIRNNDLHHLIPLLRIRGKIGLNLFLKFF